MKLGFSFGLKLFGIMCTTAGTIIGIYSSTGSTIPPLSIYVTALICIIFSLVSSYIAGIGTHMPDIFSDEESIHGNCLAELCPREKLYEACDMTKLYYKNEYVPGDVAEQWRLKNPKAFVDISNASGELVSSFGIIIPKENFFQMFIEGKIADTKLMGEDILNLRESKKSKNIYISGVVVRNAGSQIGHKRARIMLWVMLNYYKKYYGFKFVRNLYAVAVNSDSNALLKKCGFKLIMNGNNREDKGNLYKLELSYESWYKLLTRVGDFSSICKLEF